MQPLGARVVVKVIPPDEYTASGLVIPASAQVQQGVGVIVAVGPNVTPALAPEDKVVFGRYAGQTIELAGEEYLVVKEDEIMLKL